MASSVDSAFDFTQGANGAEEKGLAMPSDLARGTRRKTTSQPTAPLTRQPSYPLSPLIRRPGEICVKSTKVPFLNCLTQSVIVFSLESKVALKMFGRSKLVLAERCPSASRCARIGHPCPDAYNCSLPSLWCESLVDVKGKSLLADERRNHQRLRFARRMRYGRLL